MKYFVILAGLIFLGACNNSGSDKKISEVQPGVQPQSVPPPTPTNPSNPSNPSTPVAVLPELKWGFETYTYTGENNIRLEVLLSKASDVPVTFDVDLINGTAVFNTDFLGFSHGGNTQHQTLVIPPGQTRLDLPRIGIENNATCDSRFTAKLTMNGTPTAILPADTTTIVLNCN